VCEKRKRREMETKKKSRRRNSSSLSLDSRDSPDDPLHPSLAHSMSHMSPTMQIPKFTRKKFELATKEPLNPIKQDEKKGQVRK